MADRATLHLSKIETFAAWAIAQGWTRDLRLGMYQVLRLRKGATFVAYYRRDPNRTQGGGTEHATATDGAGEALVRRWLRER